MRKACVLSNPSSSISLLISSFADAVKVTGIAVVVSILKTLYKIK
jgi:hypothetical protein